MPTWQGWLIIVTAILLIVILAGRRVMSFLAVERPTHGSFLVVEGWVSDYGLMEAARLFKSAGYRKLLVTGTEIEQGRHISVEKSYAQLAAGTLRHAGFEETNLVVLPSPKVERDRTFTTALAVKEWLRANDSSDGVDVFTIGPHARRTWVLYSLALGRRNKVGVISFPNADYDPEHWWRSSAGFRETIGEVVAYVYAKFLFQPKSP